ncbi:MAG TPA: universal stress protein [Myxococcaceae bacterium]|nr:universal stress protein [Myxococcaceae bacterium]
MKLLLAVDGSQSSEAPLGEVLARPWPKDTQVRVVTVVENPAPPPNAFWPEAYMVPEPVYKQVRENAEKLVARMASALRERGFTVETQVRQGDPRSGIVDEAVDWKADLVLVGSHGYTGLKRFLMGSVAQYVVGHAPCSVEVVRPKPAAQG